MTPLDIVTQLIYFIQSYFSMNLQVQKKVLFIARTKSSKLQKVIDIRVSLFESTFPFNKTHFNSAPILFTQLYKHRNCSKLQFERFFDVTSTLVNFK